MEKLCDWKSWQTEVVDLQLSPSVSLLVLLSDIVFVLFFKRCVRILFDEISIDFGVKKQTGKTGKNNVSDCPLGGGVSHYRLVLITDFRNINI